MKCKITLQLLLLWITVTLYAQQDKTIPKLTTHEKIWIAAYDDTTKALASLFLSKRNQIRKEQETGYYVLGASVVVLGTGIILSSRDTNSGTGGATEEDMNMSFVPYFWVFQALCGQALPWVEMLYCYILTR